MKVCIIGAGVSGLISAIELGKSNDVSIDIYEKNIKAARKLLASGNGRCNITNCYLSKDSYNNPSFASYILKDYSYIYDYLTNLGLLLTSPDECGRVYPISYNSNTVYDCLMDNINKKNTKIIYSTYIDNIVKKDNKYIVNNTEYDYVIVSIGSMADEKYEHNKLEECLIKLGLTYTKTYPSLSSLVVDKNNNEIDGVRVKCKARLDVDEESFENSGELIFKKNEVGGIMVMELSHILNNIRRSRKINKATIHFDLLPEDGFSYQKHNYIDDKYNKLKDDYKTLNGIFVRKLSKEIIRRANEYDKSQKSLDKAIRITSRSAILNNIIHDFSYTINLNSKPSMYHVICGGIDLKNITNTLESKRNKKLYCGGEVIDINGNCGGYNISFAISSGLVIAKSILENR